MERAIEPLEDEGEAVWGSEGFEDDKFMKVDVAPTVSTGRRHTLGERLREVLRAARPFVLQASKYALFRFFFSFEVGPHLEALVRKDPALREELRAEARQWQRTLRDAGRDLPQDDWMTRPLATDHRDQAQCEGKLDSWEDMVSRVSLSTWHSGEFRDTAPSTIQSFALFLGRLLREEEAGNE